MSLKIKDISSQLDVPVSTIRYWQDKFSNFIQPSRTNGGQRRYSENDLTIFRGIKSLLYDQKKTIVAAKAIIKAEFNGTKHFNWSDKTILLTGGTGSFGKHFCRVMLEQYKPKAIRIYSRDELKQHNMRFDFKDDDRLRFFIGDVRDGERLRRAMVGVDVVVHAAALKQVPACEYNPFEAVKTNVHGAQNVIDAAIDAGVRKVVALSTDKAVNPVNLYGATKLCSDKLFIQGNAYAGGLNTKFACVRYGNVIGSRGSVVPLFKKQRASGVLTVTDKRMTRFWITLDQAVELVLKAFKYMEGGEIFVPRIPSMKITDLARAIGPECKIKSIGIRPGEKLHESLTGEDEGRNTLIYKDMYVIMPSFPWWNRKNYSEAKKLPENFIYASDTNDQWLSVEELRRIILDDSQPHEAAPGHALSAANT
ncbi:MAG TPA: UDP-N-acetylglucosamine 4,6-dehydratase (inverting) [Desulfobacterales bacterium]|nr:UDP-N-acetylglucosamine 4,6-dehydratase (inverting) [Desulfobacterales bacterium]